MALSRRRRAVQQPVQDQHTQSGGMALHSGTGNAARRDRRSTNSVGESAESFLWAHGAEASLETPKETPKEQLSVIFHVTRPADATADNLVQAGQPFTDATRYVQVDSGRTLWLDISALEASDRTALSDQLVRAGGAVRIDRATGMLVIGEGWTVRTLEADTRSAREVLSGANQAGSEWTAAAHWQFLNGGAEALEASEADSSGFTGKQTKPGAWYNHYHQDADGTVKSHTSRYDSSGTEAPQLDEAGLRALIMDCLDINGIRSALGDDIEMFREGLHTRFASGHALGASGLDWLIDELWSYLHTGAGRDGAIDIGRLQAIARALGADTATSAETNTPFKHPSFAVGDTGATLARGDGFFGRATMLSLMHLVGSINETVIKPLSLGLVPTGAFSDRDRFIVDRSGSMRGKWGPVSGAVNESMGWGDNGLSQRSVGGIHERKLELGDEIACDLDTALERAFHILHPENTRKDRDSFAALFGLEAGYIFYDKKLNTGRLRRHIGDPLSSSSRATAGYGAPGESGLKGFLMVLTHPEMLPEGDPLRTQLERGSRAPGEEGARLNAVVDEPEQSLEYLSVVQALAEALNVDVRFMATPTGGRGSGLATQLQLIDIEDISINASGQATVQFTQAGIEHTRTVDVDGYRSGWGSTRFDDAKLGLHERQKIVGITH